MNEQNTIYIPSGTYYKNESGGYSRKNTVTIVYKEKNSGLSKVIDPWINYINNSVIGTKPFNTTQVHIDKLPAFFIDITVYVNKIMQAHMVNKKHPKSMFSHQTFLRAL